MTSSRTCILSQFTLGDMLIEYILDNDTQIVGFQLLPVSKKEKRLERREWLINHETRLLPDFMPAIRAWKPEQLVQVK
ncbi:MAG: hypothetical protein GYA12_10405, partial [Chloroflexi bacterium]|nr:hypothetical protein [Chloroflexota bacterium]